MYVPALSRGTGRQQVCKQVCLCCLAMWQHGSHGMPTNRQAQVTIWSSSGSWQVCEQGHQVVALGNRCRNRSTQVWDHSGPGLMGRRVEESSNSRYLRWGWQALAPSHHLIWCQKAGSLTINPKFSLP